MEYPTDIALSEDLDIFLDGANDIATISGIDQLEQSVAVDVLDATREFIGGPVTGPSLGLLEERVEQSLRRDEQLSQVKTVNVVQYDEGNNSIEMDVFVIDDDDFTIEVSA